MLIAKRGRAAAERHALSAPACPYRRHHVTSLVWRLSPTDEPVAKPVSATRAPTREGSHRRLVYVEAERNSLGLGAGKEREDSSLHARSTVERNGRLQNLALELLQTSR